MAKTYSTMQTLGSKCPDFSLTNVSNNEVYKLTHFSKSALLVMFICNHCPFVKHVVKEFKKLETDYASKGLSIVAINSNDIDSYPEDSPDHMQSLTKKEGWEFPYLFDSTQEIAKAFKAACTPEFFLYDQDLKLVYRGQLDDSRPGNNIPVTGNDLRAAIEAVLQKKQPSTDQKPSMGCNIKWKHGNAPAYS
ncbi:MAG: thioredoxin family protein [Bdellovibrionales bacterium]|nr:thioredoxin family protein [Bdellovibrionales bacterium]